MDEGGGINVASTLTAFSSGGGSAGSYVVQGGDTLASIAQAVYGNSQYSYIVAEANGLSGDGDLVAGQSITIPSVTTNSNTANTFKPYNPNSITGSTTPSLPAAPPPPPSQAGCSALAEIVIVAVVVVASIFTAGLAAEAAAGTLGSVGFGATMSAGLAAMSGGALGVAAAGSEFSVIGTGVAVGGSTLADMAAGAGAAFIGGMAGSAAGQLAGDAMGVSQGFSVRQMLAGGLTAAAGSVIGGQLGNVNEGLVGSGQWENAALSATETSLASTAADKVTGVATHFSWKSVAASAIASGVTAEVAPTLDRDLGLSPYGIGGDFTNRFVSGALDMQVGRQLGLNTPVNYGQIAEDAFGNAIADSVDGQDAALQAKEQQLAAPAVTDQITGANYSKLYGQDRAQFDTWNTSFNGQDGSAMLSESSSAYSDSVGQGSADGEILGAALTYTPGQGDSGVGMMAFSMYAEVADFKLQQRLAQWNHIVGTPPPYDGNNPNWVATESDAQFQQDLHTYSSTSAGIEASAVTNPAVEVTATVDAYGNQVNAAADARRDIYFNQQTWWAYINQEPMPSSHSTISQLDRYHDQMYSITAPTYSKWIASSEPVFSMTDEEKSQSALSYIFSDPTGQRQLSFYNYSDRYWGKLAAIPAVAGAGLAVATSASAATLLASSKVVGGISGGVSGYISDGWKGAAAGSIVGYTVGSYGEAFSGSLAGVVGDSAIVRTGAFAFVNSSASMLGTITVNELSGQHWSNNVVKNGLIGALIPIASVEAFVVGAGGAEIFGAGISTAFSIYSGVLTVGAAALDPGSEYGLVPASSSHHE